MRCPDEVRRNERDVMKTPRRADESIEGLGLFYVGRTVETGAEVTDSVPLLMDSKRFTTHAVCVGMTGSGKTGLLINLIEEAAIDAIPTLVIDPKGDLANVLLSFPNLAADDFKPWLEQDVAARAGITIDELAERTANQWREGLEASGQSLERIKKLRDSVDMTIYTPGSRAGRPLAMLQNLAADSSAMSDDPELKREQIGSLVSGILAMAGIDVEPGTSREHVLLSTIVDTFWKNEPHGGPKLDFETLVRSIATPPMERVGYFDIENFYPATERFALANRLNTLAAAPGFDAWLEGEPLDVGKLLWTAQGKPRVSIVSIAHLSDAHRMAFVTLLAGQTIKWMRTQGGTSSLKAIFLMDEVFGYLPPTANPPSKTPLLTLLKQARAYGLGVVLATQNPVDLDYKGLSNAGTWFLGRLQTAQDKARVLDGLEGAAASTGKSFDRSRLDSLLSGLSPRTFLLHSVYEDKETIFQSRWTMSFLRGPLLREEIQKLTLATAEVSVVEMSEAVQQHKIVPRDSPSTTQGGPRPILPPGIKEVFLSPVSDLSTNEIWYYEPMILGRARVRFVKSSAKIDTDRVVFTLIPGTSAIDESVWENTNPATEAPQTDSAPRNGTFGSLAGTLTGPKGFSSLAVSLKGYLARSSRLTLWKTNVIDEMSRPGESQTDFRIRISQHLKESRDRALDEVRLRHASKMSSMDDKIMRARQKVEKEKAESQNQSLQTFASIGGAVLSAVLGRRLASSSSIGRAVTSMRSAGRAAKQQADVAHAEESLTVMEEKKAVLEADVYQELDRIRLDSSPDRVALEAIEISPRKMDVVVEEVVLAWKPVPVSSGNATV